MVNTITTNIGEYYAENNNASTSACFLMKGNRCLKSAVVRDNGYHFISTVLDSDLNIDLNLSDGQSFLTIMQTFSFKFNYDFYTQCETKLMVMRWY